MGDRDIQDKLVELQDEVRITISNIYIYIKRDHFFFFPVKS